jgi:WD40 repeat protein
LTCFALALDGPHWAHGETSATRQAPARTDRFGDPLPEGAVFRPGTLRLRHAGPLDHLAFCPNGKRIASLSYSKDLVRLWDRATGKQATALPTCAVYPFFAFSPDGKTLAVNGQAGLCLCEAATGTIRHQAVGQHFSRFGFSPDSRTLYALGFQRICLWDVATGRRLGKWPTDEPETDSATLSPGSRLVAYFGQKDCHIRRWDLRSRRKAGDWQMAGKAPLTAAAFSGDAQVLAVGCGDRFIRLYRTATSKELRRWEAQAKAVVCFAGIDSVAFAPRSHLLATVDGDKVLRLWNWVTAEEVRHFPGVAGPITFSAGGKVLAAGGVDFRVRLWDVATGRDLCPASALAGGITGVSFSPDGRLLAASSDRNQVRLYEPATGKELGRLPGCRAYAFSPDGRLCALRHRGASGGWSVGLYEPATGKEQVRRAGAGKNEALAAWSLDGKFLLTTNPNDSFRLMRRWDGVTGKKLSEVRLRGRVNQSAATFSAAGRTIALLNYREQVVRLVAGATGKELRRLPGCVREVDFHMVRKAWNSSCSMTGQIHVLPLFAPNAETVLTGGQGNMLLVWDVAAGRVRFRMHADAFTPYRPTFSPDGERLAIENSQGVLCLLDVATSKVLLRLDRRRNDLNLHDAERWGFSRDGRVLAVAHGNSLWERPSESGQVTHGRLVLREVLTGGLIMAWAGHGRGEITEMNMSPDGTRLVTRNTDGTALVWDATGRFGRKRARNALFATRAGTGLGGSRRPRCGAGLPGYWETGR